MNRRNSSKGTPSGISDAVGSSNTTSGGASTSLPPLTEVSISGSSSSVGSGFTSSSAINMDHILMGSGTSTGGSIGSNDEEATDHFSVNVDRLLDNPTDERTRIGNECHQQSWPSLCTTVCGILQRIPAIKDSRVAIARALSSCNEEIIERYIKAFSESPLATSLLDNTIIDSFSVAMTLRPSVETITSSFSTTSAGGPEHRYSSLSSGKSNIKTRSEEKSILLKQFNTFWKGLSPSNMESLFILLPILRSNKHNPDADQSLQFSNGQEAALAIVFIEQFILSTDPDSQLIIREDVRWMINGASRTLMFMTEMPFSLDKFRNEFLTTLENHSMEVVKFVELLHLHIDLRGQIDVGRMTAQASIIMLKLLTPFGRNIVADTLSNRAHSDSAGFSLPDKLFTNSNEDLLKIRAFVKEVVTPLVFAPSDQQRNVINYTIQYLEHHYIRAGARIDGEILLAKIIEGLEMVIIYHTWGIKHPEFINPRMLYMALPAFTSLACLKSTPSGAHNSLLTSRSATATSVGSRQNESRSKEGKPTYAQTIISSSTTPITSAASVTEPKPWVIRSEEEWRRTIKYRLGVQEGLISDSDADTVLSTGNHANRNGWVSWGICKPKDGYCYTMDGVRSADKCRFSHHLHNNKPIFTGGRGFTKDQLRMSSSFNDFAKFHNNRAFDFHQIARSSDGSKK
jgi:hypothetical protein